MTRRLHHPELPPAGGEIELDEASAHYARVLRLGRGDPVEVFDGRGNEADGTIAETGRRVRVRTGPARAAKRAELDLTLVLAMPKGQKLETIVRMTTELGVGAIELAKSERTIPAPSGERAEARIERLSRIALEAARQCERDDVPSIRGPRPLLEAAADDAKQKLVFARRGDAVPALEKAPVRLVVGPEGGLSEGEIDALVGLGYTPCTLGPRILRAETAAVVAVALAVDRLRAAI
jgi:16S rRNA (uracil1498-N3)-methyltransferase